MKITITKANGKQVDVDMDYFFKGISVSIGEDKTALQEVINFIRPLA